VQCNFLIILVNKSIFLTNFCRKT